MPLLIYVVGVGSPHTAIGTAAVARKRRAADAPDVKLARESAAVLLPRLIPIGLGVGAG